MKEDASGSRNALKVCEEGGKLRRSHTFCAGRGTNPQAVSRSPSRPEVQLCFCWDRLCCRGSGQPCHYLVEGYECWDPTAQICSVPPWHMSKPKFPFRDIVYQLWINLLLGGGGENSHSNGISILLAPVLPGPPLLRR